MLIIGFDAVSLVCQPVLRLPRINERHDIPCYHPGCAPTIEQYDSPNDSPCHCLPVDQAGDAGTCPSIWRLLLDGTVPVLSEHELASEAVDLYA